MWQIEYLISKLIHESGKGVNFDYGNFEIEKFNFKNLISNSNLISNWVWPPMGWGWCGVGGDC